MNRCQVLHFAGKSFEGSDIEFMQETTRNRLWCDVVDEGA
jgi:hypothetical protein